MKKQLIVFAMLATVATSAFAGLNPIVKNAKATETTVKPEEAKGGEDDALNCKIYENGEVVAECWFCSCEKLYDKIHGSSTKDSDTKETNNQ